MIHLTAVIRVGAQRSSWAAGVRGSTDRPWERRYRLAALAGAAALLVGAPSSATGGHPAATPAPGPRILVEGSSTVFPISEAAADEFQNVHAGVRIIVAVSGTSGGFERFLTGRSDINDASRAISRTEADLAERRRVRYIEVPIGWDGLSVAVNAKNDWVEYLTVEDLRRIWQRDGGARRWSDLRPNWPDLEIRLYGPDPASGTLDYFIAAIFGPSGTARPHDVSHEDDNVLAQGIATDEHAIGYFGYTYYIRYRDRLRAVPIDAGTGPVLPSAETIENGSYRPLSRLLLLYVREDSLVRPEVEAFVDFYVTNAVHFVAAAGAVPLPETAYGLVRERLRRRCTGSLFMDGGGGAAEVLRRLRDDGTCQASGEQRDGPGTTR